MRHAAKGEGYLEHGTRTGHNNYGCRCPLCIAADRAYKRDRYQKLKPQKQQKTGAPDPDQEKDDQVLRDLATRFGH